MRFGAKAILSGLLAVAGVVEASTLVTKQKRAFVDVCAQLDVDLNVAGIVFGKVDVCLCLSALPLFITTDATAKAAVKVFGADIVTAALKLLINAVPHPTCTYPDNSVPACTANCGYTCKPPYIKSGNACVLPPSSRKRALASEEAVCPFGLEKCGVMSSSSSHIGFECLDTVTNLESCGGCLYTHTGKRSSGTDCTALEGVSDVRCVAGSCVVRRCRSGWAFGADGVSCVEMGRNGGMAYIDQTVF